MTKTVKRSQATDIPLTPETVAARRWELLQRHNELAAQLSELLQSQLELGESCLETAFQLETPENFTCDIAPHLETLREIVAGLITTLKLFDDPKAKALVNKLRKRVMVGSDL